MFYGWYLVTAGALLMAYTGGALIYGFTAFINPIVATFSWSYAQISLAISIRGAETGALNPFLGMAVDRWPARRLTLIGIILMGLGLFCLSQTANLAMFYAGFLIMGLGSSLATQMVPTTTVARWFRKNIGKASGILAMGTGIGGALVPLLVKVIDTYGWQNALIYLAIGIWVLGIPLSFLFRDRPEDYGLLPDGQPQDDTPTGQQPAAPDIGTGVRAALKMPAFWFIGIASLFQMAAMNAGIIHMMPYLDSLGMERSSAGMVVMLVPLVSLPVRIPYGLLADMFQTKYVMAISTVLISIGLFIFWLLDDGSPFWLVLLFAIAFGCGMGGFMPLRPPLLREYFGTRNFGTIFGLTSIFTTIGIISSPPLAGWVYDTLGVYDPVWLVLGGLAMAGAIIIAVMPSPSSKPK